MKTETLIELQRSEPLNAQLKELENYCAAIGFSETATAIALVPELIAEVIRLRALLAEVELDLAVAVDSKHSTTAIANVYDKVCIGRAALANDK